MKKTKKLGVYWGYSGFCFVEFDRGKILKFSFAPNLASSGDGQQEAVPEEIRVSATVKNCLAQNRFSTSLTQLALPAKDLIFRSFTIPAMQPAEIKNVVDFEITKYIPIKPQDLVFRYQAIPYKEKGQKNLRIYLIAIRKDILKRYKAMMELANLQVDNVEPAPVSVLRFLKSRKIIPRNQSTAIVEVGDDGGDIIICNNEVVQFVREFPIAPDELTDVDLLSAKIVNDIRVSFNFYNRQNPSEQIHHILILSLHPLRNIEKMMNDEFKISVRATCVKSFFQGDVPHDGFLKALGVAMADSRQPLKDFNLLETAATPAKGRPSLFAVDKRVKTVLGAFAAAVVIVFSSSFLSGRLAVAPKAQLATLEQQDALQKLEGAAIEKMSEELKEKLAQYHSIRLSSETEFFLHKVPSIMPEGVWLKSFTIRYSDVGSRQQENTKNQAGGLTITLEGLAYHPDSNEQFRRVNNFLSGLKTTESFSEKFNNIELTTKRETVDKYELTTFRILCN